MQLQVMKIALAALTAPSLRLPDEEIINNEFDDYRIGWNACLAEVKRLNASAPAVNLAELVPDGWKLVPVEITQEMVDAHFEGVLSGGVQAGYRAMLAAAPEVESE